MKFSSYPTSKFVWILALGSFLFSACGNKENNPAPVPENTDKKEASDPENTPPPFNSPQINFEHFGRYDLATWTATAPQIMDNEGDTVMESVTYTKDDATMVVETSQSEYGHNVLHTLKGKDGKVQKTHFIEYNNNPNELIETVNDYTLSPTKKFTRSQKMEKPWQQVTPLPISATGTWKEGEADQYGDPDH
ncbi:MAG: hypothetical protein J0L94_10470 [Rhodothermia bacterium]|nr:hypothetical protein [Rhodothermia bacterium]